MHTSDVRRGRPRAAASLHSRMLALLLGVLLLAAGALIGAPAAQALPKGAYWYTLLDLPKAWKISEGAGVTVGLVDSGVQADLGDLKGQVLPGLDLTGQDPGAQRDNPVSAGSQFGHGTDMAVYIAGTGKGAGLVGVAPKAKILPVDVTSADNSSDADIATGVRWAVDHGAKVVNVSLGSVKACESRIGNAFRYAYQHDVIVVAAAGDSPGPVSSPANCAGALAVSGVDAAIKPWTNSSSGPETAFAAPAYGLINELLNGTLNGPSAVDSGTSAATAIVSGTFALLRSRFPTESARQIVTRALYNVHNGVGDSAFGRRVSDALGYGMILPRYALTDAPPANAKKPDLRPVGAGLRRLVRVVDGSGVRVDVGQRVGARAHHGLVHPIGVRVGRQRQQRPLPGPHRRDRGGRGGRGGRDRGRRRGDPPPRRAARTVRVPAGARAREVIRGGHRTTR